MNATATKPTLAPFQQFLDEHRGRCSRSCARWSGPHDADDCFQETFIAALRAYERMDGRHPRAWVMTIARRKAIDHHRARARRPEPRDELPEVPVVDDRGPTCEIWTAVAALPDGQRAAVALRYGADLRLPRDRARRSTAARRRRAVGWPTGCEALRKTIDREEATR